MTTDHLRIIAARWVFPVWREPIYRGWVKLRAEEVLEFGRGKPPGDATDLGDVAILPGLVNAHTHLEFSDCARPIGKPGIELHDWIGEVIAQRVNVTPDDKQQAICAGIEQSRRAGVRLLGEITSTPSDYPAATDRLDIVLFAEILGLDSQRGEEKLADAVEHNRRYESAGWSPHAPYSTPVPLIRRCVELARQSGRPLAMHVAESPAERELITCGSGPLAQSLRDLGVWQDNLFPCAKNGFVDLIEMLSLSPSALLIHGNDLRQDEIDRVAGHPNMSVVYCPRTHAFFGYEPHPLAALLRSGVRVALGTDSRASNPDLNLWREVQFLLNHRPDVPPHRVLRMGCLNGADSLQRTDLGRIDVGCRPGLGTVATNASTVDGVWKDFAQRDFIPL